MTSQSGVSARYPHLSPQVVLLDPGGVVVLKMSPFRRFWFFVASLLLAICGIGVWAVSAGSFWAWAGVLLIGLGAILFVIELVRPDSLTLAPDGFSYRSLGRSVRYAWSDVAGFGVLLLPRQGANSRQVGIRFRTRGGTLARQMVSGLTGRFDGALPESYGLSADDLVALMEEWRSAATIRRWSSGH